MHLYHFWLPMKRGRILTDENRSFKAQWEVDYFMIETPDHGMMCPICEQVLKTVKSVNVKQLYRRHESHRYAKQSRVKTKMY